MSSDVHSGRHARIGEWLRSQKGVRLLWILGAIGIGLLLISEWIPSGESIPESGETMTTADYTAYLETRLEELVGSISGAGSCQVMVTLENGVEYIYATEDKTDSNYRQDGEAVDTRENVAQSVIVVNDQGLLVTEILPQVKGVVVVCEGGGDTAVQARISAAIGTVLQISEKRVCVLQQS